MRPGKMSDKLLGWSLDKCFPRVPHTKGKNSAMVSSRNEAGYLPQAEQDRSDKAGSVRGV